MNIPHPFADSEISNIILNNFVKSSHPNQTIRNLICMLSKCHLTKFVSLSYCATLSDFFLIIGEYGLKILCHISPVLSVELREELNSYAFRVHVSTFHSVIQYKL